MSEISKVYELLNQLLSTANISKEEFQSKALIRYSIVERILRVFLFKNNTKTPIDLYRILNFIKERHESDSGSDDIKETFEKIKNLLTADQLCFYKKIIEEIITFPTKLKSNSSEFREFTQENAVSEMESYLNKHIHINFFHMKSSSKKWDEKYFNESYIKHHLDKVHFEYSICSFTTMFKILKFFETQSYTSKDPEALENCDVEVHGMISQKKLYNYLGFKGKEIDFLPTNLISAFIDSHIKEITQELYNAETLVNNFEVENNICFSLFLIKKIIKDYSFYFDKKPELEQIFLQLRKFKNWPIPVGNFGMHLYETIINELYFQGVTILNELRKTFYIDLINPKVNSIDTKEFTSAIFVYYYDDERLEKANEELNKVDLNSILTFLCKKRRKKNDLSLREFMAKLFITIIRNSRENINSSTYKNIMNFLLQKKSDIYTDIRQNSINTLENDDDVESENENNRRNFRTLEDNTKTCIDTLLKIITVGLDKNYDDFMQDVNMLVKPIIKISSNFNSFMQADISPITDYRSYLKPFYADKKRISVSQYVSGDDSPHTQIFNLYEIYKQNFWQMFHSNFAHLLEESGSDINKQEEKRKNIYHDYRLKLVLIEDKKVLSSFIENLRSFYKTSIFQNKFNEDYEAIWCKFMSKKEDFEIKYTLYIVPFELDNIYMKPTNISNTKEKNSDDISYLISEYLSQHDHIYRYTIYIPWGLSKENELTTCMYKINEYNSSDDQFGPTADTLYSYLYEPLNMYVRDSEHIFNLHLYKLTIKNGEMLYEKIFWKSVEISFGTNKTSDIKYKHTNNINPINKCNVTMECVDFLGVQQKEKDSDSNEKLVVPIVPHGDYNMKIFNLFFRKDPPFCYNTSSNNGWLEVYMSEKKFAQNSNFIGSEFEYFKSVVIPQFELEAIYRNHKVTKLEIKPESQEISFNIKIDDFPEFNSKDLFANSFVYNEITTLKIEEYVVNGSNMSVPIATFMPF